MKYRSVLIPRYPDANTVLSQEALETAAQELRAKGSMTLHEGCEHREVAVTDIHVTQYGIEGVFESDLPDHETLFVGFSIGTETSDASPR